MCDIRTIGTFRRRLERFFCGSVVRLRILRVIGIDAMIRVYDPRIGSAREGGCWSGPNQSGVL
jgi:hypothetical protein